VGELTPMDEAVIAFFSAIRSLGLAHLNTDEFAVKVDVSVGVNLDRHPDARGPAEQIGTIIKNSLDLGARIAFPPKPQEVN